MKEHQTTPLYFIYIIHPRQYDSVVKPTESSNRTIFCWCIRMGRVVICELCWFVHSERASGGEAHRGSQLLLGWLGWGGVAGEGG